tara:strand:+ start:2452 stop:3345 length:894 start_codon:yes stop_codon:yes gene_type:complete
MINRELISIILPTYNRAKLIKKAITSVINQTYENWELIIVDNFSFDNTHEVVNNYKNEKIRYFKYNNDGVIAKSRNFGIKKSIGNLIAFLDSDDIWLHNKLSIDLKCIKLGADLVYSDMYIIKNHIIEKKFYKRTRTRILKNNIFEDLLAYGNAINNSSVLIKKKYLERAGYFAESKNFVTSEDFLMWIKVSKLTNRFVKNKTISGYLNIGNDNATSLDKTIISMNQIYKIYNEELTKINKKPIGLWYTLSRSYLKNKNYKGSFKFAFKAFVHSDKIKIKIKCFITLIHAFFMSLSV